MCNTERTYAELLYTSSRKYAAWDPEITMKAGDYGRFTKGCPGLAFWRKRRGVFLKLGNIYEDGKAQEFGVPEPKVYGRDATEGITWLVSQNAQETNFSADVVTGTPALATCNAKASFKFSSGRGAVLAMENDAITTIDRQGSLISLLQKPDMRDVVIVSEVHTCASYARYLGTPDVESVSIGLSVQGPGSDAAFGGTKVEWVRSNNVGNFKSKVNKGGERTYCPLFRLVSLEEESMTNGLMSE